MNETAPSLLLMLEAAAPFFILSIVLALALMSGRKKMKKAAKELILDVKANDKRDKDALKSFLNDNLKLKNKELKNAVKKISNERKFLLRNIISGILDKNLEAISNLNQDLNRVCKQYHQLEISIPEEKEESPPEEIVETPTEDKSKELKKEIKNLKQEVHITLTTLNNIFKEFSSMFGEDIPEGDMSVEQIITAMESFSNKESKNPSPTNETTDNSEDKLEEISASETNIDETAEENLSVEKDVESVDDKNDDDSEDAERPEEASISEQLDNILEDDGASDDLDFSGADEVDDIDGALDMLELDSTDDEGEPDWGDAFAESGDVMEEEDK